MVLLYSIRGFLGSDGAAAPLVGGNVVTPVDPNPPAPLLVSSNSLTSDTSAITMDSRMSCATRSPGFTAAHKLSVDRYCNNVKWHGETPTHLRMLHRYG
jgi:hypothetical protein